MQSKRQFNFPIPFITAFLLLFLVQFAPAQEMPLALNWDKVGCQTNSRSAVKFDSKYDDTQCLEVCKNSTVTYRLTGDETSKIVSINWEVIGGSGENSKDFIMPVKWNNEGDGSLHFSIVYKDQSTFEKTICVRKLNSTLLLGWDKIGCQLFDDRVTEIRYDESINTHECLSVCPGIGVTYTISGDDKSKIDRINWTITGGKFQTNSYSTDVIWDDSANGTLEIDIDFLEGAKIHQTLCTSKTKSSGGGEMALNAIKFDYDQAGNQVKRQMIYLPRKSNTNANSASNSVMATDELYSDISYYPNPVKQDLYVKWKVKDGNFVKSAELYSITGQLMKTFRDLKDTDNTTIDFNGYPSGLYNLILIYSNSDNKTLKIMKQ